MNGPDHYREADRLLRVADDRSADLTLAQQSYMAERAQAHATLAVAAALANLETGNPDNLSRNALDPAPGINWDDDSTAWKDVLK